MIPYIGLKEESNEIPEQKEGQPEMIFNSLLTPISKVQLIQNSQIKDKARILNQILVI